MAPKSTVTDEQQSLIDVMLAWQDYEPQQRTEAGQKLAELGDPRPGVGLNEDGLPDIVWCEVPGSRVRIGSDDVSHSALTPQQIDIPTFYMAKYPITYVQFQTFLDAEDGFDNDSWWEGLAVRSSPPPEQSFKVANHPRDHVSWYDAIAFCRWLSDRLGHTITLPTEHQWEKAARDMDARVYPWGNTYKSGYANIDETFEDHKVGEYALQTTTPVGMYPQGVSPYDILDLSGNVWEWTLAEYAVSISNEYQTLRGGSWRGYYATANAIFRGRDYAITQDDSIGFRVVATS